MSKKKATKEEKVLNLVTEISFKIGMNEVQTMFLKALALELATGKIDVEKALTVINNMNKEKK
jgi:hypothetical protein